VPRAISNTSPLLFLHRIGGMPWLSSLSQEVWTPEAVISELETADQKGYETPNFSEYAWLEIRNPVKIPADWLSEDLGLGELAAMALARENNDRVLLLDDGLARKIARSAGLEVWGTLRILLEVKKIGLVENVSCVLDELVQSGMWLSTEIKDRILSLAGEKA